MMADSKNTCRVRSDATSRPSVRRASHSARTPWISHHCEPVICMSGSPLTTPEATPIWLAALIASRCQANADGRDHAVLWNHVSGRALYTNSGSATETIEPLGVTLQQGHTVAVS